MSLNNTTTLVVLAPLIAYIGLAYAAHKFERVPEWVQEISIRAALLIQTYTLLGFYVAARSPEFTNPDYDILLVSSSLFGISTTLIVLGLFELLRRGRDFARTRFSEGSV